MSSNQDILALASQVTNFTPAADRRPSYFLSLAPTTSASYPQSYSHYKPSVEAVVPAAKVDDAVAAAVATPAVAGESVVAAAAVETTKTGEVRTRRSSSLSSASSGKGPSGFRFLKLSPVHWGEHVDDHKLDWNEVAIE